MTELQEIAPPEPELTPEEMIARAAAIAFRCCVSGRRIASALAMSRGRQRKAHRGRLLPHVQPRRFGGYEFDVPTFYRVMMEMSRGCIETGWVVALTSGHPLLFANFPERGAARSLRQRRRFQSAGSIRSDRHRNAG